MKHYTDLDVWKCAREIVTDIYKISTAFPKEEIYGLTSQIRRSAISIPSNIAEGQGRNSAKDSIQFFYISRGSLYELETQLYLSEDLGFINEEDKQKILDKVVTCRKMLNGLISYYKSLKSQ